jgi:hypothetical protein
MTDYDWVTDASFCNNCEARGCIEDIPQKEEAKTYLMETYADE